MNKIITIAHGNGGEENNELIKNIFYKHFVNDILEKSEDAAVIEEGKLAFISLVVTLVNWPFAVHVTTWR